MGIQSKASRPGLLPWAQETRKILFALNGGRTQDWLPAAYPGERASRMVWWRRLFFPRLAINRMFWVLAAGLPGVC